MTSYSPVYSAAFVQYTPSTPNLEYEVPAGFTAVVRQISGVQEVGATAMYVQIRDSVDAPALTIAQDYDYGAYESWIVEGRWVVPENGLITFGASTIGSQLSAYVGGYLLRNVLT